MEGKATAPVIPIDTLSDSDEDGGDADCSTQKAYAIEAVLKTRRFKNARQFYIKWEGYPSSENTWEPESGVGHVLLVQKFLAKEKAQRAAVKDKELNTRTLKRLDHPPKRSRNRIRSTNACSSSRSSSESPPPKPKKSGSSVCVTPKNVAASSSKKDCPASSTKTSKTNGVVDSHAGVVEKLSANWRTELADVDSESEEDKPKVFRKYVTTVPRVNSANISELKPPVIAKPKQDPPAKVRQTIGVELDWDSDSDEAPLPPPSVRKDVPKTSPVVNKKEVDRRYQITSDSEEGEKWSDFESGDDEEEFEVEAIIGMRGTPPNREFRVKWLNYSSSENSWEPEDGVKHLKVTIAYLADRIPKTGTRVAYQPEPAKPHRPPTGIIPPKKLPPSFGCEPSKVFSAPAAKPKNPEAPPKRVVKIVDCQKHAFAKPLPLGKMVQMDPTRNLELIKIKLEKTAELRKRVQDKKDNMPLPMIRPAPFTIPLKAYSYQPMKWDQVNNHIKPNDQKPYFNLNSKLLIPKPIQKSVEDLAGILNSPIQKLVDDLTDEHIANEGFPDVKLFRLFLGDLAEQNSDRPQPLLTDICTVGKTSLSRPVPERFDALRKRIAYLKKETFREHYLKSQGFVYVEDSSSVAPLVTNGSHVIERACRNRMSLNPPIRNPEVLEQFTKFYFEKMHPVFMDREREAPIEIRLFLNRQMKSKEVEEYLAERDGIPIQSFAHRKTASKQVQRIPRQPRNWYP